MPRSSRLVPSFLRRLAVLISAVGLPLVLAIGFLLSWPAALATLGVLAAVLTGAGAGMNSWLRRRVIAPLDAMEETAGHWRREKLDARTSLTEEDELGRLAGRLNSVAGHLEKVFAKLTVKTRTDLVTGLPSRAQLLLDISLTSQPVLFLVNVDSFKEINDSFGNRAGDLILMALAERLEGFQSSLPYKLYKMPADEFALLFDVPMDESDVATLAEALARKINARSFPLGDQTLNLHVTCGVARGVVPPGEVLDRGAWPHLVAQADMALKKAKKTLLPFLVFQESLEIQREFERSLFWKNAVSQALQEDRIIAYYQPIFDNITGEIVKYETLVRLLGIDNVIYLPAEFLEAARRSHFDGAITRAMVAQSFAAFEDLPYEFSINLTVRDMLSPDVHRFLHETIAANPATARRLVVEILESEGIENYREVKQFLTVMKESGVKVAIDDFGSGYSNFDHILKLEVDYIKLDASLIRNLDTDRNAQIIVKTIVGFSKELGLKTISEHVHTPEVHEAARNLGVDFSQGFFLGRPGPMEKA